jgi:hypothetical protein
MSLEDQVKFHEQLLRSIESNLGKVTDDLAKVTGDLAKVTGDLVQLTGLVQSMGVVMLRVAERQGQQDARIDRLEELFERWLRSQTNGQN